MLSLGSTHKFSTLQYEITPVKVTVDHEINSWNETHNKQQVVYRHKRRKMLKSIEEHQVKQAKYGNNLEQLRLYKENLLKSTAKKLSERTLPTATPNSYPSGELKCSETKKFNFHIRSLTRSNHEKKPIVISEFDPNAEVENRPELELEEQKENRLHKRSSKLMINGLSSHNQANMPLPKRNTAGNKVTSLRPSNSQALNAGQSKNLYPQSISNTLLSRRLVTSRV